MQPTIASSSQPDSLTIPWKVQLRIGLKALRWCGWVLASGIFADLLAEIIMRLLNNPDLSYTFLTGQIVCGFAICLTGAILVDDIFFSLETTKSVKLGATLLFATAAFLVAMSKCGMRLKEDEFLSDSFVILLISLGTAWGAKFHTYRSEYIKNL